MVARFRVSQSLRSPPFLGSAAPRVEVFPFILCESCGAATILREARHLENQATCPECGARNRWQLICDQCHSRFRAPAVEESPAAGNLEAKPETAAAPAGRPKRRIN